MESEQVLMEIQESHKRNKGTCWSHRVTEDLRAKGIRCGKNRVASIMRNNGIVALGRRFTARVADMMRAFSSVTSAKYFKGKFEV